MVQQCSSTFTATACKNFHFILSERSDFHIALSIAVAVHALSMRMWTSFLLDEILLPRHMNWSTIFRGFIQYCNYLYGKVMNSVILLPSMGK